MKLYSAKIRLQGDVRDEVRKENLTKAELKVLKVIHGNDAIHDVVETGVAKRDEAAERDRLAVIYGEPRIAKIFGVKVQKIEDDEDDEEEEVKIEAAMRRTRPPRLNIPASVADSVME